MKIMHSQSTRRIELLLKVLYTELWYFAWFQRILNSKINKQMFFESIIKWNMNVRFISRYAVPFLIYNFPICARKKWTNNKRIQFVTETSAFKSCLSERMNIKHTSLVVSLMHIDCINKLKPNELTSLKWLIEQPDNIQSKILIFLGRTNGNENVARNHCAHTMCIWEKLINCIQLNVTTEISADRDGGGCEECSISLRRIRDQRACLSVNVLTYASASLSNEHIVFGYWISHSHHCLNFENLKQSFGSFKITEIEWITQKFQ